MVEVWNLTKEILLEGLGLFSSPLFHPEMLWIVIPVILSWVFAEYFQEKMGTDMGNAISNGAVALWAGIDWTRNLLSGFEGFSIDFLIKESLCIFIFGYGLTIIILGVKGKKIIRYIGRVREVTYFILAFTPIVYGYYEFKPITLAAIFVFFPFFYGIVELIDRISPPPVYVKEKEEEISAELPKTEPEEKEIEAEFGVTEAKEPVSAQPISACPYCDKPLTYIPQYQRYYCYNCRRYI